MMEYVVDGRTFDIVLAFQRHEFGCWHAEIRLRHHLDTRIDKRSLLEDMLPDHQEASKPCPLIEVEEIILRLKQQAMDTDLEFTGAKMHVITGRGASLRRYMRPLFPGGPDNCLSSLCSGQINSNGRT